MLFGRRDTVPFMKRLRAWIWPQRGWKRAWSYAWHRVTRISGSPHAIALGFAAGILASFTPFMGFHFLIGAILALVIGGNVLASAFGTFFGNPLTFPLIWISTYNIGGLILGYDLKEKVTLKLPPDLFWTMFHDPMLFWKEFWGALGPVITPMVVGGLLVGPLFAVVGYALVRAAVRAYQTRRRERRVARNGGARLPEDRGVL